MAPIRAHVRHGPLVGPVEGEDGPGRHEVVQGRVRQVWSVRLDCVSVLQAHCLESTATGLSYFFSHI